MKRGMGRSRAPELCAVLVVFSGVFSGPAAENHDESLSASAIADITILHERRKKPLDTYARLKLLQFRGRRSYGGRPAIDWLARVLFDPHAAADDRIFLINDPSVADALGIPVREGRRYSLLDLHSGFGRLDSLVSIISSRPEDERTAFDAKLVRLDAMLREYGALAEALGFLRPDPLFSVTDSATASFLGIPPSEGPLSYLEMLSYASGFSSTMQELSRKDRSEWTGRDSIVVSLSHALYTKAQSGSKRMLRIVPQFTREGERWLSPWELVSMLGGAAPRDGVIAGLGELRTAYLSGNQERFDRVARELHSYLHKRAGEEITVGDHRMELLYNRLNAFLYARFLFLAGLLLGLWTMTVGGAWARRAGLGFVGAAVVLCLAGLVLRTLIMGRPPVANLYETFVFVGWTTAVAGLVLERFRMHSLGLLIAGLGGFLFLHIAGRYAESGDTMGMLQAVLNSGFWLTSHIMTIALGYAGCCAAGIAGHVYLVRLMVSPGRTEELETAGRAVYGLLAFGLIFTLIGTVLGGMWAEQSWGRFWGWDPKENGALLILLWITAVLHARAGRLIGDRGMAAGAIVGDMLVLFAWVGVNLLGVGLHSYGFTSSGAFLLYASLTIETAFLVVSGIVLWMRGGRHLRRA